MCIWDEISVLRLEVKMTGRALVLDKQMGLGNTKGSRHLSREKEAGSWWVVKSWLPYIGLIKTIFPLLTRWKFQHPPPNRGFAEPKLPTNWRWFPCIISAILNTGLLCSIPEERWENKWGVLACFYPILGQESWTLVVNFLPHCRQWGCISLDKASQPARLLNREFPKEPCCDYGSLTQGSSAHVFFYQQGHESWLNLLKSIRQ